MRHPFFLLFLSFFLLSSHHSFLTNNAALRAASRWERDHVHAFIWLAQDDNRLRFFLLLFWYSLISFLLLCSFPPQSLSSSWATSWPHDTCDLFRGLFFFFLPSFFFFHLFFLLFFSWISPLLFFSSQHCDSPLLLGDADQSASTATTSAAQAWNRAPAFETPIR